MEDFIKNTIPTNNFQIEDVYGDNACFYRALANIFNYYVKSDKLEDIKQLKMDKTCKELKHIINSSDWGFRSDKQDILAIYIQEQIYKWISNNKSKYLKDYHMNISDIIQLTHNLSIKDYLKIYKNFAGLKLDIPERWGGLIEQIVISELYQIPITIITSQKFNKRSGRINTGRITNNKAEKGVRFKILQNIGNKYKNKRPIYLLWKKHNKTGHYMALYPII